MNELRELSLFSGYGGFSLGLKLTGIPTRTVMYVEWERYPQEIIKARINDKILDDAPIWGDISTLDGEQFRGVVDIITGGFPCQPHSVAGLRRGADDERNLWPATIRIIREVRPRYVILENVPGILSASRKRGTPAYGGTVVGELAQEGYRVRWETVGADDVGAPHRRKRWLCFGELVNAESEGSGRIRNESGEERTRHSDVVLGVSGRVHDTEMADSGHDQRGGWDTLRGVEEEPRSQKRTHEESSGRGESPSGFWSERESGDGGTARELAYSNLIIRWPGQEPREPQGGATGQPSGNSSRELADSDSYGQFNQSGSTTRQDGAEGRKECSPNSEPGGDSVARERVSLHETGLGEEAVGRGLYDCEDSTELADSDSSRSGEDRQSSELRTKGIEQPPGDSGLPRAGEDGEVTQRTSVGNSDSNAAQGMEQGSQQGEHQRPVGLPDGTSQLPVWPPSPNDTDGWERILRERPDLAPAITKEAESEFRGVANGRSSRVDIPPTNDRVNRLKALGNGVVPSVVTEFLRRVTI
jgi:site-specific DNA-cytosine methylase